MNARNPKPVLLAIGGSDPSGGAGIQLDLKVGLSHGVHVVTIITALTAQNTKHFLSFDNVRAEFFSEQWKAITSDFQIGAIKLGMLGSAEVAQAIGKELAQFLSHNQVTVIIDPVLSSSTGAQLFPKDALAVYREVLLPYASIVTPNLHELSLLTDADFQDLQHDEQSVEQAAQKLILETRVKAVLVKDGHSQRDPLCDQLFQAKQEGRKTGIKMTTFSHQRLYGPSSTSLDVRGTGCFVATTIACLLLKEMNLADACGEAITQASNAIATAEQAGEGFALISF